MTRAVQITTRLHETPGLGRDQIGTRDHELRMQFEIAAIYNDFLSMNLHLILLNDGKFIMILNSVRRD